MKRAFTLYEIVIVVAIVALLAAIAMPQFVAYRETSHRVACQENIELMRKVCITKLVSYGVVVRSLDELCVAPGYFIKTVPKCPLNGVYTLKYNEDSGEYEITCSLEEHQ